MKLKPSWLATAIALGLSGCDFAPRYTQPSVALPAKFKDTSTSGLDLSPNQPWWKSFHSPTMDLSRSMSKRRIPDLAAAIAANDAAQAQAQAALSGLLPQINGLGYVTSNKQSTNRPLRSLGQPNYFGDNLLGGEALLRDRHLGPGQGHRGRGDGQRRGEHGRARAGAARTACRTRERLRQPSRPRRSDQAARRHDPNL